MIRLFFIHKPSLQIVFLSLGLLAFSVISAAGAAESPLKPIDTSSPKATLQSFIELMDKGYEARVGLMESYLASSRLFLSLEEVKTIKNSARYQESAQQALDLSEIPPDMAVETARRLAVQLKGILDRIDVPPFEAIPDAQAMASSEFKRWSIPNSGIRIQRIEKGPRAGEYLFTPETLNHLPEFWNIVRDMPYKPGASVGWYDFATYSPVGVAIALHQIVPPRWLIDAPKNRNRLTILDQPLWRWCGILIVLSVSLIFIKLCFRLRRYWIHRSPSSKQWANLLRPLSVMLATSTAADTFSQMLRISGIVYEVLTPSLWALFYFAFTWMVWVAGGAMATSVIKREHLRIGSIDSQLIRMVVRLLTFIASIAILVSGADHLGLPAYSMLAGFGVGGLAVALAAQQTLANLLGSLIIMFEKPFALGDSIKLKETEGTVVKVGFRSTRIRTLYNSIVTIPSSQLVNSMIDNLALREFRQVVTTLTLTYDTPVDKIERFIEAIKNMLEQQPNTRKDNIQVYLYEFGPASLNILLNFFIQVSDRNAELKERQQILLDILRLAEDHSVQFAFPTQTLHIKNIQEEIGQSVAAQTENI